MLRIEVELGDEAVYVGDGWRHCWTFHSSSVSRGLSSSLLFCSCGSLVLFLIALTIQSFLWRFRELSLQVCIWLLKVQDSGLVGWDFAEIKWVIWTSVQVTLFPNMRTYFWYQMPKFRMKKVVEFMVMAEDYSSCISCISKSVPCCRGCTWNSNTKWQIFLKWLPYTAE